MMGKTRVVPSLVLVAVLLSACSSGARGKTHASSVVGVVGRPAPSFTLPSASGPEISLAQFRGHKPVLLYFSMGPG